MAELIQYANGVPGIKWPLDKLIIRIGRSENLNDILVDDGFASKTHAQIEIVHNEETDELEYYLRDLHSTNHTYHNQSPIEHVKLTHNDTLMIGKSKFVILIEGTRDYVSVQAASEMAAAEVADEQEASLTDAVEEITGEFKKVDHNEGVDATTIATDNGHLKFSRRLNIY